MRPTMRRATSVRRRVGLMLVVDRVEDPIDLSGDGGRPSTPTAGDTDSSGETERRRHEEHRRRHRREGDRADRRHGGNRRAGRRGDPAVVLAVDLDPDDRRSAPRVSGAHPHVAHPAEAPLTSRHTHLAERCDRRGRVRIVHSPRPPRTR